MAKTNLIRRIRSQTQAHGQYQEYWTGILYQCILYNGKLVSIGS